MNLKFRTFLVISIFAGLSCLLFALLIFRSERQRIENEHQEKYLAMATNLGAALTEMEGVVDGIMRSALFGLVQFDRNKGRVANDELRNLRDQLGVSDIFIIKKNGQFDQMTDGPVEENQPNLFSFCSDYKKLIEGHLQNAVTPIIPVLPKVDGTIKSSYKFMMTPNYNKTLVLEVGVKLDFIVRLLQESVKAYPEILALGLYAPNGSALGEYASKSFPIRSLGKFNFTLENQVELLDDVMVIWKKVPASLQDCCECKSKSLIGTKANNDYFYYVRAVVSRKPVFSATADLMATVAWFCLGFILLSFLLGRVLADRLLRRFMNFIGKIESYLSGKLRAKEVNLPENDEIGFLSRTFSEMLEKLERTTSSLIAAEKQKAAAELVLQKAELANQVSHDIRSPLAALNMVIGLLPNIEEEKRLLIRNATQRINDIANLLLKASIQKTQSSPYTGQLVEMLSSQIEEIVSEKRIQYLEKNQIKIDADLSKSYGLFATINSAEFKSVISNLINNSIDAFDLKSSGYIHLRLEPILSAPTRIRLTIEDNGKGIPPEILSRLGKQGFSHGKENHESGSGSGLGLYQAIKTIEGMNGKFEIQSQVGVGTTVTITLQAAPVPNWFLKSLNLNKNSLIISIDDDLSIHQLWVERLLGLNHLTFTAIDSFKEWYFHNKDLQDRVVYLMDFEFLNQTTNGLRVIEDLQLSSKAILVTSRHDDRSIRNQCSKLNIKLIPKGLAGFVPVTIDTSQDRSFTDFGS